MRVRLFLFLIVIPSLAGPVRSAIQYQNAFPHLQFTQPIDIQNADDGSNRLFIGELAGQIWVIEADSNTTEKKLFLDLTASVGGGEGFLGFAFHPDYENNRYLFVNYTAASPLRSVIARVEVSSLNPDTAIADSQLVILEIPQPFFNHNGGQIAFGPDGYLYVPMGDGGDQGDPNGNGQNRTNLLSTVIRIDVDIPADSLNYSIPLDNPFVGNTSGIREEIFAYGLRNPWRCSFDPVTGWLWVGDVGQDMLEEVNIIKKAANYGWNVMEGTNCYNPPTGCDTTGIELPVWQYTRPQGGFSITGGYVYRGSLIPELTGQYIFGDWGAGTIWALDYDGQTASATELFFNTLIRITSFGLDEAGEVYFCDWQTGLVHRLLPCPTSGIPGGPDLDSYALYQNHPNPFNPATTITFRLPESSQRILAEIDIYDVRGAHVTRLIEERRAGGVNTTTWDGTDGEGNRVASGVYFYTMRAGGAFLQRKMILLR